MKSYGEDIPDQRIAQKLLISLSREYDSIAEVIAETKDIETIGVQESKKNWKSQNKKKWEGKSGNTFKKENQNEGAKGPCKICDKLHYGPCWFKGKPKCFKCERFGHLAKDCSGKTPQAAHYAKHMEEEWTMFYACHVASAIKNSSVWYVDSACSNHMTSHESLLIDIDTNVTAKLKMGAGDLVQAIGKGTLMIETKSGPRHIKEVMLVPGLDENLLSVGQMIEHGYFLLFDDYIVEIYDDKSLKHLVTKVPMTGNRCFPLSIQYANAVAMKATFKGTTWCWHRRYGHLNLQNLKLLQQKELVYGLLEIGNFEKVCQGCAMGKSHREAFDKEKVWRASMPLELIHSDVCGPMQSTTIGGNIYFLTFIDDCTRMCWVYFMQHKSEVFNIFKKFKAMVEL
ncbi:unnamed protein product [Prunus armeniaca]